MSSSKDEADAQVSTDPCDLLFGRMSADNIASGGLPAVSVALNANPRMLIQKHRSKHRSKYFG